LEPGAGGRFVDRASGTEFNVLGHAVGGPLRGTTLRPVPHGNHFWFAWAAFKPATRIRGDPLQLEEGRTEVEHENEPVDGSPDRGGGGRMQ
jgi:Protein of unknown function (DUF3179)